MKICSLAFLLLASGLVLAGINAGNTSGLTPINDLGPGEYKGFQGGLFPGGRDNPPLLHRLAALERAE